MLQENMIAKRVVDICFHLHKRYGPGLFESVYEEILCFELQQAGLSYLRQHPIPVVHQSIKMELGFRADLIIEDYVLLELKSVEKLADVHFKQVQTYLKLTNLKFGLLVNCNVVLIKDGIHRIANNL